jgi:protease IV
MDANEQKQNYNYTPPTNSQPQVVYVEKPKKANWWKYLLGCAFILSLIGCVCVLPILFAASVSNELSNAAGGISNSRIEESIISTKGNSSASESARIAVINISGEISYTVPGSGSGTGASSQNINEQLKKASEDDSIDAVLLRFNTPGGEVSAAQPICSEIQKLSAKKPTYAFIDSEGASLGYLLPNCTKFIYARPEAVTGSIGVVLQAVDIYGVLEHFGGKVVFVTNTAGTQKTGQEVFDTKSETYKIYQSILDETYNYFIDTVYNGRKVSAPTISKDDLKKYADGRIFSGRQAKDLKLVDELGQFDDVIDSLIEKEQVLNGKSIDVVEYNISSSPFDQLFFGMSNLSKSSNMKTQLQETGKMRLLMQSGLVNLQTTPAEVKTTN